MNGIRYLTSPIHTQLVLGIGLINADSFEAYPLTVASVEYIFKKKTKVIHRGP